MGAAWDQGLKPLATIVRPLGEESHSRIGGVWAAVGVDVNQEYAEESGPGGCIRSGANEGDEVTVVQHEHILAAAVGLSVLTRIVCSGHTRWAIGKSMYLATVVFVAILFGYGPLQLGADLSFLPFAIAAWLGVLLPPWRPAWRFALFVAFGLPALINITNSLGGIKLAQWPELLATMTTLYAGVYLAPVVAFAPEVKLYLSSPWRLPPSPGRCTKCGYSLQGLPSSRCPECGHINEGDPPAPAEP